MQNTPNIPQRTRVALSQSRSPAETDLLGASLAAELRPGDCLLLSGPLGAGKSQLARAIIRARLGDPEAEVPSPSYTLVNVHGSSRGDIWHADLYRLGAIEELDELGLEEALCDALILVEWGERWSPAPPRHLHLRLSPGRGDAREIRAEAYGESWEGVLGILEGRG